MEENIESFSIEIDLLDINEKSQILVIPSIKEDTPISHQVHYTTVLDGVLLAIIYRDQDQNWEVAQGSLDNETVNKIGQAIEGHYL